MATSSWVKTHTIFCERVNDKVDLLEERIFPSRNLPDVGQPYHVRSRKCSHWLACNMIEAPCCYSGANPGYDPFQNPSVISGQEL